MLTKSMMDEAVRLSQKYRRPDLRFIESDLLALLEAACLRKRFPDSFVHFIGDEGSDYKVITESEFHFFLPKRLFEEPNPIAAATKWGRQREEHTRSLAQAQLNHERIREAYITWLFDVEKRPTRLLLVNDSSESWVLQQIFEAEKLPSRVVVRAKLKYVEVLESEAKRIKERLAEYAKVTSLWQKLEVSQLTPPYQEPLVGTTNGVPGQADD